MVARAKTILASSSGPTASTRRALVDDLPLFARRPSRRGRPRGDRLREALDAIDPDALTPREALEALYRLKAERVRAGLEGVSR